MGIIEKEFWKRDCNCCCVTLCRAYFRKKDHRMLSSARQASIQGNQRFCSYLFVQKPFSFKNSCGTMLIGHLLRPSFVFALHLKAIERRVVNSGTNDH